MNIPQVCLRKIKCRKAPNQIQAGPRLEKLNIDTKGIQNFPRLIKDVPNLYLNISTFAEITLEDCRLVTFSGMIIQGSKKIMLTPDGEETFLSAMTECEKFTMNHENRAIRYIKIPARIVVSSSLKNLRYFDQQLLEEVYLEESCHPTGIPTDIFPQIKKVHCYNPGEDFSFHFPNAAMIERK